MAKRKPKLRETYTDADGIERDTRTRRRIIRVGARAAHVREAEPGKPPRRRPSVVDMMEVQGLWSKHADRNRILAECARTLARRWYDSGLAHLPKSPNLLGTGAGTGDPAHILPSTERAIDARQHIRWAQTVLDARTWQFVEAVVCEDTTLEDAGRALTGRQANTQARAVSLDRVAWGIEVLAVEERHIRARDREPQP